jgi:uncharacterized protein YprB with RNaseH-like and TPR domain
VFDASDRIRRILSDGNGFHHAPPSLPASALPASALADEPSRVRERLSALGITLASRIPARAVDLGSRDPRSEDARSLAEIVGASLRETPHGPFLFAERRHRLDALHGRVRLGEALSHRIPLRPHEQCPKPSLQSPEPSPRGPERVEGLDLRRAVFLDTETTGLSGGTGTVVFLVGTGRVEGDEFVVRQYALRDYPDEAALLHALAEDLADAPLVTFNGRSFDWPLLTTRLALHRRRPAARGHLDLLTPARRIWARTLPSRSLATLERHILGYEREDDLPGWQIPEAWFAYLRTGRAGVVARAFRHNEEDVLSMLALLGRIAGILADPTIDGTSRDALGTAGLLIEIGDAAGAHRCLEAGLEGAAGEEARHLRRMLAALLRRLGEHERALAHWLGLARSGSELDVEAYEQVAKIYEHRLRDAGTALHWVQEALDRALPGSRAHRDFLYRADRLRRRLSHPTRRTETSA